MTLQPEKDRDKKVISFAPGVTLVETVITLLIISVALVGLIGTFKGISQGIYVSKTRTLATNLAQEQIETLKNISYYRLLTSNTTTYATESGLGGFPYDIAYYPPETINIGGITFERRTYVEKVRENSGTGLIEHVDFTTPDTDLKRIITYVVWREGADWKSLDLRNLRENPKRQVLDATFNGSVTNTLGGDIENATVEVVQNSNFNDLTDATGDYSFKVSPGTYTIRASKFGFFSAQSNSYNIASGANQTVPTFTLTEMATGTVTGMAYIRDHLVISQVVGATISASGFCQEYVELYNPTTSYIQMVNGMVASIIQLKVQRYGDPLNTLSLSYSVLNASAPPNSYFLIANTTTVTAAGVTRNADAYYLGDEIRIAGGGGCGTGGGDADGVGIAYASDGTWIDRVGWDTNPGTPHTPPIMETDAINQVTGLEWDEQYIRRTNPTGVISGEGRAYDSNNNESDFLGFRQPLVFPPRNTSDSEPVVSGTPAAGALVFADDELSSPVTASSTGYYILPGISTGAWTLASSINTNYGNTSITITPSTTIVQNIFLTSSTSNGYISGRVVSNAGTGLGSIAVAASGTQVTTNSGGYYYMSILPGTHTVTTNPGNINQAYTTADVMNVFVSTGQLTSNIDFTLPHGGIVKGYLSTNGIDPLPGIPISASKTGIEYGSGMSGSDGRFTITNLSTGTYTISPITESGESSSPVSVSSTVVSATTVFVSTFVISNSFGKITGALTVNSSTITTGVLIVVTTGTITVADPPINNNTLRSGSLTYYGTSSLTDGTYEIRVPGSATTYNVYAWYTTWNGSTPNTEKRSATATVAAGATVTRNFSW